MQIQEIEISRLVIKKNVRRHPKSQIDQVVVSIQQFGFCNPILVSRDLEVVAGHARLEAAKKLKLEKVPCVTLESLSEQQIRAYKLVDNRLSELSKWDFEGLLEEIDGLNEFSFEEFGFDENFLGSCQANLDATTGGNPFQDCFAPLTDEQKAKKDQPGNTEKKICPTCGHPLD